MLWPARGSAAPSCVVHAVRYAILCVVNVTRYAILCVVNVTCELWRHLLYSQCHSWRHLLHNDYVARSSPTQADHEARRPHEHAPTERHLATPVDRQTRREVGFTHDLPSLKIKNW